MYNFIFAPAGSEGGSFYELKPLGGAEILTDFLDPDEEPVLPGMVRFENKAGGHVAITAFDLQNNISSAVFNYRKKELVCRTMEWLGREPLPACLQGAPNTFCIFNRSKSNAYAIVVLIGLGSDPLDTISLEVAPEWIDSTFERLDLQGEWRPVGVEIEGRTIK